MPHEALENRYFVIKIQDLEEVCTMEEILDVLYAKIGTEAYRLCTGKKPLKCVVVEEGCGVYDKVVGLLKQEISDGV